ncbi:MAG: PH domain-containing protein [Betaproteobacteria bacterium]|nr:PH domain-containing protein [Betaproteobacteria bacterium]
MVTDDQAPHIYHVGPWRYLWLWLVFGPLALIFLALGLFSEQPGERAPLLIGGALWLLVPFMITLLVRMARLEISARGVRLRQIGYRLEAAWPDVSGLRLDRGHEGFITARPVGGSGAGLLAAAGRAIPLAGAQFYDDEQQRLLDEHRLIPIEAFVWHLRHGKLRADIARFAPHLEGDLAALDRTPGRSA